MERSWEQRGRFTESISYEESNTYKQKENRAGFSGMHNAERECGEFSTYRTYNRQEDQG